MHVVCGGVELQCSRMDMWHVVREVPFGELAEGVVRHMCAGMCWEEKACACLHAGMCWEEKACACMHVLGGEGELDGHARPRGTGAGFCRWAGRFLSVGWQESRGSARRHARVCVVGWREGMMLTAHVRMRGVGVGAVVGVSVSDGEAC